MAHAIETMAFTGDTPWHGLGIQVGDDLTPEQILIAAELGWTVSKRPMFFSKAEKGSLDAVNRQSVTEHYALVRDTDQKLLDVVGARYQPTQNKDAFEFFDNFVKECKLKMHTAGSLCGGQYVWALAKTEQTFRVSANDSLDSYVLLMSPHKLGKSLTCQHTSVRVVCKNTLNLALKEGKAAFRMSHARKFDDHAKAEAAKVLGLIRESFSVYGAHAQHLASRPADIADVREYFGTVFKMDDKMIESEKQRKNGLMQRLLQAYEGDAPGANLSSAKGTWWGALNAVTFVLDHNSGVDKDRNLKDNWLGWRGDAKRTALELARQMAA